MQEPSRTYIKLKEYDETIIASHGMAVLDHLQGLGVKIPKDMIDLPPFLKHQVA